MKICIFLYGLDQDAVGYYSKKHTKDLAALFEVHEDNLFFVACDCGIYNNGVEQNCWNTLVVVRAPKPLKAVEENATKYLAKTLNDISINLTIQFEYFEESNVHYFVNNKFSKCVKDQSQFIETDESFSDEDSDEDGDNDCLEETCSCGHHHHHEHCTCHEEDDDDEEIYMGNAFKDILDD